MKTIALVIALCATGCMTTIGAVSGGSMARNHNEQVQAAGGSEDEEDNEGAWTAAGAFTGLALDVLAVYFAVSAMDGLKNPD